jgi:NADH:ubiquinone oxidoreductase subunit 5 (subunit L)/multisubunit Na+/H+ antiporter MnhA subunit
MEIKVKKKFVSFITFGFAAAITLWPFGIFLKAEKYLKNVRLINHEKIHWEQSKELLGIFFYLLYFLEWFFKLFIYGKKSYRNISFERESNNHEYETDYLRKRKKYSWFNYIFEDK